MPETIYKCRCGEEFQTLDECVEHEMECEDVLTENLDAKQPTLEDEDSDE